MSLEKANLAKEAKAIEAEQAEIAKKQAEAEAIIKKRDELDYQSFANKRKVIDLESRKIDELEAEMNRARGTTGGAIEIALGAESTGGDKVTVTSAADNLTTGKATGLKAQRDRALSAIIQYQRAVVNAELHETIRDKTAYEARYKQETLAADQAAV